METTETNNPAHMSIETILGEAQIRVANKEKVMFFYYPPGSNYALVNRVRYQVRIEFIKKESGLWDIKHWEIRGEDKNGGGFHRDPSNSALVKITDIARKSVNGRLATTRGIEALEHGEKGFKLRRIEVLSGERDELKAKLEKLEREISELQAGLE